MSSIVTLLNQIKQEEIVLPAIQRDFVWPEEKVLRLLDSIMRGYPIGIALLWETYLDLQYRKFADDFHPGAIHAFKDNKHKKKLKLVLDGQQRLQSLYIALYGSYEGKSLYFDVLSGRESDDLSDEKYEFEFLDKEGIKRWESQIQTKVEAPGSSQDGEQKYLVKVADLFTAGVRGRDALAKQIKKQVKLSEDDEGRLGENLARFHDALTSNASILMVSVIDENLQSDHSDRKSEADVLEIFVRVNREGTPLSRSDLIFSMLKLNWRESAESLPEFVRQINEGNSFDLDTDFVIRCLFAVSDLGTKFELDLLRKKNNVDLLRKNFQSCCDAIRSVVDSVSRDCWCASSSLLGGQATLVPFVYYLFHTPKHEVPTGQIDAFRKALYLSAFARPFSRYADSRLWKFIRQEIKPLTEKNDYHFPFDRLVAWVKYWESVTGFDERLLQSNVALILEHARLLEQFAERCGQFGAMHWLGYFLGGRGARWKRPCVVLFLRPGADARFLELDDLRGAALFYELSSLGIRTGAFSTDDWEGLRTVIAEPALRHQVAALATQALLQQGAQVVLTTYCAMALDEASVGPMLQGPGTLWAEHDRAVTKRRLILGPTYEETLARFGKRTRTHLRYYRKRLLARMDCEFIADAHTLLNEENLLCMNAASRNPLTVLECKRRYRATRDLPGGFMIALRAPDGQLLSIVGGWRQGTTTVMHHQMNASGYEKDSLSTVMRSYFLESEIERGTRTLIFYHGTNDTISHAFEAEITRDLIVRRKSIYAYALRKLAGFLVSPQYYAETHFLGGSTTFFASVLTSDKLEWNSVPAGR